MPGIGGLIGGIVGGVLGIGSGNRSAGKQARTIERGKSEIYGLLDTGYQNAQETLRPLYDAEQTRQAMRRTGAPVDIDYESIINSPETQAELEAGLSGLENTLSGLGVHKSSTGAKIAGRWYRNTLGASITQQVNRKLAAHQLNSDVAAREAQFGLGLAGAISELHAQRGRDKAVTAGDVTSSLAGVEGQKQTNRLSGVLGITGSLLDFYKG